MCNIVYAADVRDLDLAQIKKSWDGGNDDGAGFIARGPKGVQVVKGIMDYPLLKTRLERLPANTEIGLHLRFGTHGVKRSREMTHPFKIRDNVWLMHNGVLSDFVCKERPDHSDSSILASDLNRVSLQGIARILEALHGKYLLWTGSRFELYGAFQDVGNTLQSSPPIVYKPIQKWGGYSDTGHKWGYHEHKERREQERSLEVISRDIARNREYCTECSSDRVDGECLCRYSGVAG